jgi:hypothetical protein
VLTEMLDIISKMSGDGFGYEQLPDYCLGERFRATRLVDGEREVARTTPPQIELRALCAAVDPSLQQLSGCFRYHSGVLNPSPGHRFHEAAFEAARYA